MTIRMEWQPIETCRRHVDVLFYREDAGIMFGQYTYCADWISDEEQAARQYDEDTLYREDPWAFGPHGAYRLEGEERPTHWMDTRSLPLVDHPRPTTPVVDHEGGERERQADHVSFIAGGICGHAVK
jgi:hypothetical protein